MNSRQKEVYQATLHDEQVVMKRLESNYTSALARIRRNIKELQANPLTQSKAYQLEFQKQLEAQISGILDTLQGNNFSTIADYLNTCYQTGFIGTAYDWQGQGVPLIIPIDQKQVIKAVQKTGDDFKLSNKLGVNTKLLKEQVKTELQRGLASQMTYADIARNITEYGQSDVNRSMLIARTEGHRVQNDARLDAMQAAKKKGADIEKQWDSTLDGETRPNHRLLDGQIKELDEPFEVSGMKVNAPGHFGIAAEDCNCRCCLLQRARWALKEKVDPNTGEVIYEDKEPYQKWNNEDGGFIKCSGFKDFEQKYLKQTTRPPLKVSEKDATISQARQTLKIAGVEYNEITLLDHILTDDEIIKRLGGGDMTSGSCSSLALAYSGNANGFDVLDFRGGKSCDIFSTNATINEIASLPGVNGTVLKEVNDFNAVNQLLQLVEEGKDYYLATASHAAIIRKTQNGFQYLELQSATNNGWKSLTKESLRKRFGCKRSRSSHGFKLKSSNQLIECDSLGQSSEFQKLLGYINTKQSSQKKGLSGRIK